MSEIVIISAVYPPEPQVSARMSLDLANHLAEQGHAVTVLCPQPSRPINTDYSRYKKPETPVVVLEGKVRVIRLPSFAAPASQVVPRLWESLSFGRQVIQQLKGLPQPTDVIYVNAWPIISQALIAGYARKRSIPFVLQVMDLYPESLTNRLPAALRALINNPLKQLDSWVAKSAAAVVVISENMEKTYTESRQIPADKIDTIPTWQDESFFDKIPSRAKCCAKYGIPESPFTFLFLGNIGPVAGVDFLIQAFAEADIADAQLVIAGDGTAKLDCVQLADQLKLANVYFVSDPNVSHVPMLQAMAHVCMLPMKLGSGMSSIPSKLPAYLFSAKPVIATVDQESDTAGFVLKAECGWVGNAEDLSWLATTMWDVARLPAEQLEAIGQKGKAYGVAHFSKKAGVVHLSNMILRLASNNRDGLTVQKGAAC